MSGSGRTFLLEIGCEEIPDRMLEGARRVDEWSQVEKAASSDDARPILTGVLMAAEEGGLRLVSTDSYRLSVRDLAGTSVLGEGQKVLVPSRALKELARVVGEEEEITLRLGERDASFQVGSVSVTTRLIEGDFPNYRGLIPTNHPNKLTVDRTTLLDAVRGETLKWPSTLVHSRPPRFHAAGRRPLAA